MSRHSTIARVADANEGESAGASAADEITVVPTERDAVLVRLEQAYLVQIPHRG